MFEKDTQNLLRNSSYNLSVVMTGGGTDFIPKILTMGGMSEKIHDIYVPYSQRSLNEYLNEKVEKCVCAETALKMAQMAFSKNPNKNCIGIGLTCSLMKHENERIDRENLAYFTILSNVKRIDVKFDLTLHKFGREFQEHEVALSLFENFINYLK